ncbi:MAG: dihydrolipoyllysine-residue succinyltransferase, partial [Thiobacillus sp.]|nr:dihydrolipoyllysine-residue succinyltransferase [Thiobacillus sp.]
LPLPEAPAAAMQTPAGERREPLSRLRQRVAERLVAAQHTAAMLTTFNEVNMQAVNELRQRMRAEFEVKHGVKLGYMSFFVRAVCRALAQFPVVNAAIDGNDIAWHDDADIGIAISTPRGLVVPILRRAQTLAAPEIEAAIADFAARAKEGRLALEELAGGTFSITNGGVFGSLLSTPILNPPQSAILGMHAIQDRPVAEHGQVVVRPMMYLALTYDHRLIDGRDAVQFLVAVKAALESPAALLD